MIWKQLQKPIFILAPMEDVTDTVFRQIISSIHPPSLYFTEFTNVDGFFSPGHRQVSQRLQFEKNEKPIIAQVWGMKPENYFKAAKELNKMHFDGIDINMGCPQRNVTQKGACAALINNHSLAKEIIQATKEGAGDLPVSVKTRLGFKENQREDWMSFLLEQHVAALTIHGRTAKEMSASPAHWDEIGKVVAMRNRISPNTFVIGNGDVTSLSEAKEKAITYGLDGIMIGRGIFHNPWLFDENKDLQTVTIQERLLLLQKHTALFDKTWGNEKPFQLLKKYFKIYLQGFPGAADLRLKFMETKNKHDVDFLVTTLLDTNS